MTNTLHPSAREKHRHFDNLGSPRLADALLMISLIAIATFYFVSRQTRESEMPRKIVDSAEQDLYLTAGGTYTSADIAANGNQTASERFTAFQATHDFNPQIGDAVCPITRTKANLACSWIIGGNKYFFCCPPCIDEFLMTAKSDPTRIKRPSDYVRNTE